MYKKYKKHVTLFALGITLTGELIAQTTKVIEQHGIVWNFTEQVEYGKFANGDYWVKGPVTLTSIDPKWDGLTNGWEINPRHRQEQAFIKKNGQAFVYEDSLRPKLPFTVNSGSIVKIIGGENIGNSEVKVAGVLTVLEEIPENRGEIFFRPPYIGDNKPLININKIRYDLLPTYLLPSTKLSLDQVRDKFSECLHMTHHKGNSRFFRPQLAMYAYQPRNTIDINEAILRLMGNESIDEKSQAMIHFTQFALDVAYIVKDGFRRRDNGHSPNWRLVSAWAAVLLDLEEVKNILSTSYDFHEDYYLYRNKEGIVLWGEASTEDQYWHRIMGLGGSRSRKDPYEFIDGGVQTTRGARYQEITSQSLKGQALIYHIFPNLKSCIPADTLAKLTDYTKRWVHLGTWTSPDPVAKFDGIIDNYRLTYGSNGKGGYIIGEGRYKKIHNSSPDGGQYKSNFVADMWNTYFSSVEDNLIPVGPTTLKVE